MSGAEIIGCVDEIAKFVGSVAFTLLFVVPCILAFSGEDFDFCLRAGKIFDNFIKNTLRPLVVAILLAEVFLRIIFAR